MHHFIFLFSHLADTFIFSDLQMRTLQKQSKPTKEQINPKPNPNHIVSTCN